MQFIVVVSMTFHGSYGGDVVAKRDKRLRTYAKQLLLVDVRDCVDSDLREQIGGSLEARQSEVELPKLVSFDAGLVVERGGLDRRGRKAENFTGDKESVGGNVAELGVLFGFGGREGVEGGGVGEIDAGVPEAVTEFPYDELERVGEQSVVAQLSQGMIG
ncbi:hypothetical protein ACLB2K_061928 [Fragaria x ananassa]